MQLTVIGFAQNYFQSITSSRCFNTASTFAYNFFPSPLRSASLLTGSTPKSILMLIISSTTLWRALQRSFVAALSAAATAATAAEEDEWRWRVSIRLLRRAPRLISQRRMMTISFGWTHWFETNRIIEIENSRPVTNDQSSRMKNLIDVTRC